MIDLMELPVWWAFVGAFAGVIAAKMVVLTISRLWQMALRRATTAQPVDRPKLRNIICGECKSMITVPPASSVVTATGTQLIYRCQQCGAMVGVTPP